MDKLLKTLKTISLILLIQIFPIITLIILNIDIKTMTDKDYIIYLTLSNIILSIIFILIYRKTLIEDFKNYIKNFIPNLEQGIKYWIIGFIIMIASNLVITQLLNKPIAENEQQVRNLINISPLLMVFSTVIYAPLTEELTFRKSIKDVINNKWIFTITSGLIFGILHISSSIKSTLDLLYLIPYSSLGIVFALLYHKTDNIFSTITIHTMHNLLTMSLYIIGAQL